MDAMTYEEFVAELDADDSIENYEPCGVCGLYGHRAKEHDA